MYRVTHCGVLNVHKYRFAGASAKMTDMNTRNLVAAVIVSCAPFDVPRKFWINKNALDFLFIPQPSYN